MEMITDPSGAFSSLLDARGVSADGSVVVGTGRVVIGPSLVNEASRWTTAGEIDGLGDLPGGQFHSVATDVSADGAVVVGNSDAGNGSPEAFFWTEDTGIISVRAFLSAYGVTNHLDWRLEASGVSADGRTIAGTAYHATQPSQAFIATVPEPSTLALATLIGVGAFAVGWTTSQRRRECLARNDGTGGASLRYAPPYA
jgi:probable HAF family extracellular repeat protein